jgi:hypothetical protein
MEKKKTPARSTGRVDFVTGRGTVRFYALTKAQTRTDIHDWQNRAGGRTTPGQVVDQLVTHAKNSDFDPQPPTT